MDALLPLVIGLFAGIASGFFGIGGGIVMVPAMTLLLGFGQQRAQGTSLAALLLPVGILGVLEYHKAGNIDLRVAGLIAAGFLFGVLGGSKIALSLDEVLLRRIFAGFLVLVALQLVLKK
jgi:hypothetical protein